MHSVVSGQYLYSILHFYTISSNIYWEYITLYWECITIYWESITTYWESNTIYWESITFSGNPSLYTGNPSLYTGNPSLYTWNPTLLGNTCWIVVLNVRRNYEYKCTVKIRNKTQDYWVLINTNLSLHYSNIVLMAKFSYLGSLLKYTWVNKLCMERINLKQWLSSFVQLFVWNQPYILPVNNVT